MAVTVCVWEPWLARNVSTGAVVESGIGHASLRVGSQYLSYWPEVAQFTAAGAMAFSKCGFHNFEQDKKAERGLPHNVTHLKNLDENRIQTFIQRIFAKRPLYHVKFFNCSHPVKIALYEGTGRKISPNFKVYSDPVYGVSDQLYSELQGGQVEDWVRETWNPISVHKYAQQLQQAIG